MTLADVLKDIRDAYPRQEFGDRTIALYATRLAGIPADLLTAAVARLIDTETFPPSVAMIKAECAAIALNLPTPEEAWIIAERGSLRDAAEPVRVAAEHVGGRYAILHSDNIDTVRAQFRKAYVSARDQAIRDWISPRAELAGLTAPQALGPTMAALPESERYKPRPLVTRLIESMAGRELAEPSEAERADAIAVLGLGSSAAHPSEDPLYAMAERILHDAPENVA